MLSANCHLLHSAIVPYALRLLSNATSALEPKMVHTDPKPHYSERMENGVLYFVGRVKHMGKDIVFKAGISQQSQQRPGNPRIFGFGDSINNGFMTYDSRWYPR